MSILSWGSHMSVGVKVIDDQHKKLVAVINELDEAVVAGKGSQVHDALFEELTDYFTQNFSTEEELMLVHDYPEYELHRALHVDFTAKVKELRARALKGEQTISEEALAFLTDWLIHHDIAVDKKLGAFLVERNVI